MYISPEEELAYTLLRSKTSCILFQAILPALLAELYTIKSALFEPKENGEFVIPENK